MNILLFIIILFVLVMVHEFGHFYSAKKFGIRVDEFGFGFPPKIISKKIGETEYSLNALPFGGFVKIYGETPSESENEKTGQKTIDPDAERSLVNKPKWKQAVVLSAGIFANFVLAWILLSAGFMFGLPTSAGNVPDRNNLSETYLTVISVVPNSPAEKAGLHSGDKIISLKKAEVDQKEKLTNLNPDILKSFVKTNIGVPLEIEYMRGKGPQTEIVKIIPDEGDSSRSPGVGIAMDEIGILKLSFFKALWEGLKLDASITISTFVGLYNLIKNAIIGQGSLNEVTGPVGMVGIVGDAYRFGISYLVSFAALISINLAIINLIPFPALDGGRLFFLLIEKIKGSPIKPKFANFANMIGFSILILLMLLVTYHDILKLF